MISILNGIQSTTSALSAERTRLDIISQNIANAETTHSANGKPYQRQVVVFESALQQAMGSDNQSQVPSLKVSSIQKDPRPSIQVYEPGHPDADKDGMVLMPNVNIHEEMADMISASRTFEANLAVVKNARSMAMQTLSIGKR
jgi:flagellar basal-body rod protein FlgC